MIVNNQTCRFIVSTRSLVLYLFCLSLPFVYLLWCACTYGGTLNKGIKIFENGVRTFVYCCFSVTGMFQCNYDQ